MLTILLPLLLPTLLFAGYVLLQRRWNAGQDVAAERPVPWTLLILAGLGLSVLTAIATAVFSGAPPHSVYVPARMEDGKVVPAEMRPPAGR